MNKIIFILSFFVIKIFAQDIYLQNIEYPSNVYTNQIFKIKVKATIVVDDYNVVETKFLNGKNIILLNKDSKWKMKNNNEFYNTYIYKASDKSFSLPTLQLVLKDQEDNIKYTKELLPIKINFNNIAVNDTLFSQVIAKDLVVVNQVTKQYNNNLLLTILKINATNSNLEDFKLLNYKEQGLEDFSVNEALKSIYYYVIIPRDDQTVRFKYYNYEDKEFKSISVDIILNEDLVSTQTDLNPKNSKLLFYQKVMLSIFIVIFIALYFIYRKRLYLFILLILVALLIFISLPPKTIVIPSNTRIYILPLKSSTIFTTTKQSTEVELIKSKNGFKKIILPNQKIGWIKQ